MKKELRIPTILGLVLLALTTVGIGGIVIRRTTTNQSQADETCTPAEISVANISASSTDISFYTPGNCQVNLKLGDNIFSDARSLESQLDKIKTHYFQANTLTPSTEYKVELIINGENIVTEKTFRTQQTQISKSDGANYAWGRVFSAISQPAIGSVLYINIPTVGLLSSFVSTSGNWFIPSSLVFDLEGKSLTNLAPTDENITIIDSTGKKYSFTNNTNNNQPVPDIMLSQPDFKIPQFTTEKLTPTQSAMLIPTSGQDIGTISYKLQIKYPKIGESIYTTKPEFFGTSPQSTSLNLSLSGRNNQNSTVISGVDGTWKWSPSSVLIAGSYTLKVSTTQDSVESQFTISEDQGLAFISTPSATIIPTPTTAPAPTLEPTPTTTVVLPTEPPVVTPTTKPTNLPKTGGATQSILIFTAGLLIAGLSIFFSK